MVDCTGGMVLRDHTKMVPDEIEAPPVRKKERASVNVLLLLGFLVAWIVLQAWILPRFGVST